MKNIFIPALLISIILILSGCSTTTIKNVENSPSVKMELPTQKDSDNSEAVSKQEVFYGVIEEISLINSTTIIKIAGSEETKTFMVGPNTSMFDDSYNKKADTELSVGCHVKVEYDESESDNQRIRSNTITIMSYDGTFAA